ncbi:hypothetical protein MKW94_021546 [Papaver nudicaule]|uniref:Ninja-family protein n=1 Tax=Papaver nudicaule TaxID=74823 RepID=A0AA41RYW4_PAPNU|nr:hypothetical protein [Papaver nudicaule]
MEDGNGIELSLGLPCGGGGGGSVDKQKSNKDSGNSVDNNIKKEIIEIDESDNESKPDDAPSHVTDNDAVKDKVPENFFTNLGGKSSADNVGGDTSNEVSERNDTKFIKYEGLWGGNENNNKLKGVEEEEKSDCLEMGQKKLWLEASNNKRKMTFEEVNCSKKHERDVQNVETHAIVQRPLQGSSETLPDERKAVESVQGGKHHIVEEGGSSSSSQARDDVNENGVNVRANAASHQQVVDGFPPEGSSIRPGIAPGLRFGGSGSYPNLPWVSTTGPGPNGKTISGVAYRYDKTHVKIVCACHGSHMSGEEFVQHARGDQSNQEFNTARLAYSTGSPAASTKS